MAVNFFTLVAKQPVSPGGSWPADSIAFIVIFNAVLILGIYAVDLVIVKMRKFTTELKIGERVINGDFHVE
jgi:hypothetical protein